MSGDAHQSLRLIHPASVRALMIATSELRDLKSAPLDGPSTVALYDEVTVQVNAEYVTHRVRVTMANYAIVVTSILVLFWGLPAVLVGRASGILPFAISAVMLLAAVLERQRSEKAVDELLQDIERIRRARVRAILGVT